MTNGAMGDRLKKTFKIVCAALVLLSSAGCGDSTQPGDVSTAVDTSGLADIDSPDVSPADIGVDAGVDVGIDAEADISTDVSPDTSEEGCPGEADCPCSSNDECDSGLCTDGAEGSVCAPPCTDGNCPDGMVCVGDGDKKACVSAFGRLCQPCTSNADCEAPGVEGTVCVKYGQDGAFCGFSCLFDEECGAGYECKTSKGVDGSASKQCVKQADDGSALCECDAASIANKATTECVKEAYDEDGELIGACQGYRACLAGGLSACSADEPQAEICDGLDNDCDMEVDESTCPNDDPCVIQTCNGDSGKCQSSPADDGVDCDDGNTCTATDTCEAGACKGGEALECNDGNPCTLDACDSEEGCQYTNDDGASCEDGELCIINDVCEAGECVSGSPKDCDDGNPCTLAKCEDDTGKCKQADLPDQSPCDDAIACTTGESCLLGTCLGTPADCDDGNPCTDDSCVEEQGGCVNIPNAFPCDDGDACTSVDLCSDGTCSGSSPIVCDDGNSCTLDSCDPASGCVNAVQDGQCDDGNACTVGDACEGGECIAGTNTCKCQSDQDCANDEDGDLCNGTLFCNKSGWPYVCEVNPATIVTCNGALDTECIANTCDPSTGTCSQTPINESGSCDADGSVCTPNDICSSGACVADESVSCDDNNPCTDDFCDANSGCQNPPNTDPCDADDNPCTVNDSCQSGSCIKGPNKECDDDNLCTFDTCDMNTGKCNYDGEAYEALPCDADGNLCTASDVCKSGVCFPGAAKDCDDGNVCTDDACDPKDGCVHTPNLAPCDADGSACTQADACNSGVCQAGVVKECDDGNDCTVDSCAKDSGDCLFDAQILEGKDCDADGSVCTPYDVCAAGTCKPDVALQCDDNNLCTTDSCDSAIGCVFDNNNLPCDADGNACTQGDACIDGGCEIGQAKQCDDGNDCTVDSCDPQSAACVFDKELLEGKACDADGSVCTPNDMCVAGNCKPDASLDCDDNNPCTTDTCDPAKGCAYENNNLPCDADGNACTQGDSCLAGVCGPGQEKTCDDNNPCTLDTCDPDSGACQYDKVALNGTACDADGSVCTPNDVCSAGSCKPDAQIACDDDNLCTTDSCDPASGCTYTNNNQACDADGDACTAGDACSAGKCQAGDPKVCDDGNGCTQDSCDAASGECVFDAIPLNGTQCDADGSACTPNDTCQQGSCTADQPVNEGTECDDGQYCTVGDACNAEGACTSGPVKDCDDGQQCTEDSCDEATQACVNTLLEANTPCDDGLYCTVDEVCDAQGACGEGKDRDCGEGGCVLGTCDDDQDACVGTVLPDGSLCNADSDGCTKNDICVAGECTVGAPVNCYLPQDGCNSWKCASTGSDSYQCESTPSPEGSPCDDYLYCTVGDACDANGKCQPGEARDCSAEDDSCNVGVCDESSGTCISDMKEDGTICGAGDNCVADSLCSAGLCLAGANSCQTLDHKVNKYWPWADSYVENGSRSPGNVATFLPGGRFAVAWSCVDGDHICRRIYRSDFSREGSEEKHGVVYNLNGEYDAGHGPINGLFMSYNSDAEALRLFAAASAYATPSDGNDMPGCPEDDSCQHFWYKGGADNRPYVTKAIQMFNFDDFSGALNGSTNHEYYQGGSCYVAWTTHNWCPDCGKSCHQIHYAYNDAGDDWRIEDASLHTRDGGLHLLTQVLTHNFQNYGDPSPGLKNKGQYGRARLYNGSQNTLGTLLEGFEYKEGVNDIHGAVFENGTSIVVWTDDAKNVFAQKFAIDGAKDGIEFQVNTTPHGFARYPRVATTPYGRYIVVWEDLEDNDWNIYGQMFKNEPGNKIGSEFVVNTYTPEMQSRARIAVFSDSTFLVVWQDDGGRDGDGSGIIAQRFTASGKKDGDEFIVNGVPTGHQMSPGLAVDSETDDYLITWQNDEDDVMIRRFSKEGKSLDGIPEFVVNTTSVGEQMDPAVAAPMVTNLSLGDGSFIVTWQGEDADGKGVFAQRYGAQGLPKGNEVKVNSVTSADQWRPDVEMDQSGNYIIVWESTDEDGDLEGIYAQRFENTGAKAGPAFRVNQQIINEQMRPQVAMQPSGDFAVVFEGYAPDSVKDQGDTGYDAVMRCFDAAGTPITDDFVVNETLIDAQMRPRIAGFPDGSGRWLVAWQSYDAMASKWQIFGRVYNANCAPIGSEFLIAGGWSDIVHVAIAVDLEGRYVIVYGNGDGLIQAKRYNTQGQPEGDVIQVQDLDTDEAVNPEVSYLPNDHWVVTWQVKDAGGSGDEDGYAIKAVEFNQSAERLGMEWYANRTTAGDQQSPVVVGRPNGTWVIVWQSSGQDGDGQGIVGRLSNSGECFADEDCNDGNICTDDLCIENTCKTANNTNVCIDGNPCTTDDVCQGGTCGGTAVTCNDNNICTADSCNVDAGQCQFEGILWCNGGCYFSEEPGCDGCQCEAGVCAERPQCCSENWGSLCVQLCNDKYGGCDKP